MSLRGDRHEFLTDVSMFVNEVATKGVVMSYGTGTSSSGVSLGDSNALCTAAANPSGYKPFGMLLNDVVDIDQTRQHVNWMKDEMVKGGKACFLRQGWVVTNAIIGTPSMGSVAYLSSSGNVTPTLHATGGLVATPKVGEFMSAKDQDGFAKVSIHLP